MSHTDPILAEISRMRSQLREMRATMRCSGEDCEALAAFVTADTSIGYCQAHAEDSDAMFPCVCESCGYDFDGSFAQHTYNDDDGAFCSESCQRSFARDWATRGR